MKTDLEIFGGYVQGGDYHGLIDQYLVHLFRVHKDHLQKFRGVLEGVAIITPPLIS